MLRPFLITCLFALGFSVFEAAILSNLMFLPVIPDFLLLSGLYFSVQNGKLFGTAHGFVSGLLIDFLSAAPMGLNSLVRTLMGYIAGLFHKTLNINGIMLPMLFGFSATFLKALIIWVISLFYPIGIQTYDVISMNFAIELLMNTILTPVIFRFLDLFEKFILIDMENIS